jgi:hypothetical protein
MKTDEEAADGFLSRWARRKEQARSGAVIAPEALQPLPAAVPVETVAAPTVSIEEGAPAAEPPPTLADVALLTRESDYSRFVGAGVDDGVKQAAMKKLFTDPHFNVMDGLDTYIDDYGKPDPIPLAMLRRMTQSKFLRLFDDDEDAEEAEQAKQLAASSTDKTPPDDTLTAPDDHADLRLQQDDAARRPGADQGAGA